MALVEKGALGREDVSDLISGLENVFEHQNGFDDLIGEFKDRLSPVLEEPTPKRLGEAASKLLDRQRRLHEAFRDDE